MARSWNKTVQAYLDSAVRTAVMLDCHAKMTNVTIGEPGEHEVIVIVLSPDKDDSKKGKLGT